MERIFLKVGNIDISLALFYFLVQECTKNASLGRSILLIVVIIILFKRVHVFFKFTIPFFISSLTGVAHQKTDLSVSTWLETLVTEWKL